MYAIRFPDGSLLCEHFEEGMYRWPRNKQPGSSDVGSPSTKPSSIIYRREVEMRVWWSSEDLNVDLARLRTRYPEEFKDCEVVALSFSRQPFRKW